MPVTGTTAKEVDARSGVKPGADLFKHAPPAPAKGRLQIGVGASPASQLLLQKGLVEGTRLIFKGGERDSFALRVDQSGEGGAADRPPPSAHGVRGAWPWPRGSWV